MKKSFIIIGTIIVVVLIGVIWIMKEVLVEKDVEENIGTEDRGNTMIQEGEEMVKRGESDNTSESNVKKSQPAPDVRINSKPVLKNFGVNIEPWNKQTNLAGDLLFTKKLLFDDGKVSNDKVFIDFGHVDKYRSEIPTIEYWFFVPLKTKVQAPVDGIVQVVFFNHTQDWGINIMQEGSEWITSFEHVVNLIVKEGDFVKAGDIVGEAAPRGTFNNEIAMVELAVWNPGKGIIKYCPSLFLEDNLKFVYEEKLKKVASDWEEFIGKNVYDEEKWVAPGCLLVNITER